MKNALLLNILQDFYLLEGVPRATGGNFGKMKMTIYSWTNLFDKRFFPRFLAPEFHSVRDMLIWNPIPHGTAGFRYFGVNLLRSKPTFCQTSWFATWFAILDNYHILTKNALSKARRL